MLKTDRGQAAQPGPEAALAIGVKALEFLAGDPVHLHRFLDLSGLDVGQLRAAAAQPAFFAGLLDFLLAHEPTLLAFAADADLSPAAVMAARQTLSQSFGTAAP
jgi:gamma-glutamylcysteine synthetase